MKYLKKFENPDTLLRPDEKTLRCWDRDNVVFGYVEGEMRYAYNKKHYHLVYDDDHEDYSNMYALKDARNQMKFSGRLWIEYKHISFWEYPKNYTELRKVLDDLQKEMEIEIGDDWNIEIVVDNNDEQSESPSNFWGDSMIDNPDIDAREKDLTTNSKIIKVTDYKGSEKRSPEELAKAHTEVGSGGNVPQGVGSRKHKNWKKWQKPFENKINNMKHLKKYEYVYYNKELNPKFWSDGLFNDRIRKKLLKISDEFYTGFGYEIPVNDVTLTGSIANYNYNDFSDLDIHVLLDFKKINPNIELVKKAVDGERFMWNLRHNIRIKGHDVEFYIQDVNEQHVATGLYSLKDDKWLKEPVYKEPHIDEEQIDFKYLTYKSGIEKLVEISQREMTPEVSAKNYLFASEYKQKIQKSRKEGLHDVGEFSIENLVFKKLRNGGEMEKLINVIGSFYDKIYSQ